MVSKSSISKTLDRIHIPHWLTLFLAFLFILRIPSFFEPFYYGDEMIYLTLGEGIRRGLTLYADIHDNKPPLLYFTAAIAGNVFWFRAILALWVTGAVVAFYKLTKELFQSERFIQLSVVIFGILTTIPLLEGQIANAELFMLLPTIWAFVLLARKHTSLAASFIVGCMLAIAALFKIPAAFDGIVALYIVITIQKYNTRRVITQLVGIASGFALPIALTFVWYTSKGAFHDYLVAAFMQNFGYVSSWRASQVSQPFLVKNAPLIARGVVMLLAIGLVYVKRIKLHPAFSLSVVWLATSLFAATLSERPYPHYLIQVTPALSMIIAFLFLSVKKEQVYAVIPLTVFLGTVVYYQFWYYNSAAYYERFISYATKQIGKDEYFSRFSADVNTNYQVAQFLSESSTPNESVFIWGDSAPVYALSRRLPPIKYVANYHISDFSSNEEVASALNAEPPGYIVIYPNAPAFPELTILLRKKYIVLATIQSVVVWRLAPAAASL